MTHLLVLCGIGGTGIYAFRALLEYRKKDFRLAVLDSLLAVTMAMLVLLNF